MKKPDDPGTGIQKYRTFILIGGIGAIISAIVLALLFFGTKEPIDQDEIKDQASKGEPGENKD
jgi:hypothetical protein